MSHLIANRPVPLTDALRGVTRLTLRGLSRGVWTSIGGAVVCLALASGARAQPPAVAANSLPADQDDASGGADDAGEEALSVIDAEALRVPPKRADVRYWSASWSFDDIDVGRLVDRLRSIGLDPGIAVQGKITASFDVGIPLTALRTAEAYRFQGALRSESFVIDSLRLQNFSSRIAYGEGRAVLQQFTSQLTDRVGGDAGRLEGRAVLELVPRDQLRAELVLQQLPIAPITELIRKTLPPPAANFLPRAGLVDGRSAFEAPLDDLADVSRIGAAATVRGTGLEVGEFTDLELRAERFTVREGIVTGEGLAFRGADSAAGESLHVQGSLRVPVAARGPFSATVVGDDLPLAALTRLFNGGGDTRVSGKLDLRLDAAGELAAAPADSTWDVQGAVASPGLNAAGLSLGMIEHDLLWTPQQFQLTPRGDAPLPAAVRIESIETAYRLSDTALDLSRIDARLFGGSVSGEARLPRGNASPLRADLRIDALRPRFVIPGLGGTAPTVAMTVSADVQWQAPAGGLDQPAAHSGTASLDIDSIRVGGASVGALEARLQLAERQLQLRGDGQLFSGTFALQSGAELAPEYRWSDLQQSLQTLETNFAGVSLAELSSLIAGGATPPLSGALDGRVRWMDRSDTIAGATTTLPVEFSLRARNLSSRNQPLSANLRVRGASDGRVLEIAQLEGGYAGGTIRASGRFSVASTGRGSTIRPAASIGLTRVDLRRGLWFLGENAANFAGHVSGRLQLSGTGRRHSLRGSLDGRELMLYGIPVGDGHSGVRGGFSPISDRWGLRFSPFRFSLGMGEIEGTVELASPRRGGGGVDLDSSWDVRRVDVSALAAEFGKTQSYAHGRLSGDLTLGGRSIASADDLRGRFRMTLGETQGAAIPGMRGIERLLGPVSVMTTTFDRGEAAGAIGAGSVRLQRFALASDNVAILANGSVYLRSGRMNLDTLVATGDFSEAGNALRATVRDYALATVVPSAAVLRLVDLLEDRTLVLDVGGTLDNPVVRLKPLETAREQLRRFLTRQGQQLLWQAILGVRAPSALDNS